jgi:hypothetical protein
MSSSDQLMTTATDQTTDLASLAKLLISRYGEQARAFASHQALKARERGDQSMMEGWRSVAAAVDDVLRAEPDEEDRQR